MKQEVRLAQLRELAGQTAMLRKMVIEEHGLKMLDMAANMSAVIGAGGKLLMAGNGGSAADASHFAGELIVRLSAERKRQSLPALALNADTVVMTAAANDFGYEHVFARQVEGLGNRGDMLLVISTSGNSENLVRAVQVARERKMLTAALLGGLGGKLLHMVDRAILIPSGSTQRIQEEHIFIIHQLVEYIESDLFG